MILPLEGYPSSSSQEWEPLARISKNIQLAVMATEDQKFPHHHGVDLDSLFKVISGSRREHSFTRSEYDQPTNGEERVLVSFSSYVRKAYELYFSLLMKLMWSKERILEVLWSSALVFTVLKRQRCSCQPLIEVASSKASGGIAESISNQSVPPK
ncbi:transglycosylase domain-containing protein [Vibrio sp. PNB22_4_2]